ncbi:hypothetical protein QBC47DRAFT_346379 [Echria macrotheca]|uniref:Replication protein A subunit n=1 Tax=Echria macrotheca TaxID=438768 RepID=A0AAJ0BAQ4_9PEZI|nr:hypothetical protein QBC47DRAFT_346379 [Echria macrotheca]
MAEAVITQGAVDAIFNDPERASREFPVPILQCLQVKTLDSKTPGAAPDRFRLVLSDVKNYVQCMLATQANHVVHDGFLDRGSIIRMKSYQAQHLKGRSVLIVLDVEVIDSLGRPDKIGDPKPIEARGEAQNTTIGGAGFYGGKTEDMQDSKAQVQRQINTMNQTSRGAGGGGGGGGTHGGTTIYPIESLSMYSHKWTIKARVTQKSDIKTWHKASGEGKLFSVNLLDESGEIRATGFNDQVDQFYEMLQEGKVYYISTPCRVQLAKKQFTNLPNDYELTFERDTLIEKAEDQSSVPQVRYNFCSLQDLQEVEKDATVDVIGVLKEAQEVSQIVSKTTQKPYDKRELTLVDDTQYSVRVTIWGKTATAFDAAPGSIVAFKGTKVGDFGGRSLSLLSSGTMTVNPDIPEAHRVKGWFDAQGASASFATHSNLSSMGAASGRTDQTKSIAQVKEEQLGMGENPDYFTVKATVVHIRQETFAYPACLNEGCSKKVADMGDGTWRCEKCNMNHDRPNYRYIMSLSVNDHTGQLWLSCFDDSGRIIMGGKSANEIMELRETDDTAFAAAFEAANCRKYSFRCRAKMDTFGDTQRVRYQVMGAAPIDYKSEAHKLAELIKQYSI